MAGRRSRFLGNQLGGLSAGDLVVFDGQSFSSANRKTPSIDAEGNLKVKGKIVQTDSIAHVKDVHSHHIKNSEATILVDSTQGKVTLTLPKITSLNAYQEFVIKDSGGKASKCPIVVETESPQDMIQSGHSFTITHDYGMVKLLTDGSKWLVMSEVTQLRPWRIRFV